MNLNKKCLICGDYFPAEPLELKFYCEKNECQKRLDYKVNQIKRVRSCSSDLFDIYDLDRPTNYGFERVCRICGSPLLKKDGTYSYHRRYCGEHNGYGLWTKYNWSEVSKKYAIEIRDKNKELIIQKTRNLKLKDRYINNLTICEKCGELCQINDYWDRLSLKSHDVINIHHIIPVHTLTIENLYLIWEKTNLIALCPKCHNDQDHQLKKTQKIEKINFRSIMDYIREKC